MSALTKVLLVAWLVTASIAWFAMAAALLSRPVPPRALSVALLRRIEFTQSERQKPPKSAGGAHEMPATKPRSAIGAGLPGSRVQTCIRGVCAGRRPDYNTVIAFAEGA